MRFFFIIIFVFCSSTIFGQGFGSELTLGIDYFNDFAKSKNTSGYQELVDSRSNLGLKLSTNVVGKIDFGLSMDIYSLSDNFKFLDRAYFYGAFISYNFFERNSRANMNLSLTTRAAKHRGLYKYPFHEPNAPWSLYSGIRLGGDCVITNRLPNLKAYIGFMLSFPTYRHSFWSAANSDYSNFNWPYIGVAYTLGKENE